MSRPPIKAVEQIKNYCEKTQCRRCIYGYREKALSDDIDYVGCQLQMNNPCDWEIQEQNNDEH